MLPEVGGKSPVTVLNSVVLPAPLAPSTARFSPAATVSDTSSTARSAPKLRVTRSSTRASADARAEGAARGAAAAGRSELTVATSRALRAIRHVARADLELRLRGAQQLVHAVHLAVDLVEQVALRVLHHLRH